MKHSLLCSFLIITGFAIGQNVGIGTGSPLSRLHVMGSIRSESAISYITLSPNYLSEGPYIIMNDVPDNLAWYIGYKSAIDIFRISIWDGFAAYEPINIHKGGNVGIHTGNNIPNATLQVNGSFRATSAAITGNITVNNGYGIIQNGNGSSQLKYYTKSAYFETGNMPGLDLSNETTIDYSAAGFSNTPRVLVGNIVSTGGTAGELYRVQLVLYGATPTSCKARLLNTSPNAVNYNITWNIICIGND